jgi:hypothetical protein
MAGTHVYGQTLRELAPAVTLAAQVVQMPLRHEKGTSHSFSAASRIDVSSDTFTTLVSPLNVIFTSWDLWGGMQKRQGPVVGTRILFFCFFKIPETKRKRHSLAGVELALQLQGYHLGRRHPVLGGGGGGGRTCSDSEQLVPPTPG